MLVLAYCNTSQAYVPLLALLLILSGYVPALAYDFFTETGATILQDQSACQGDENLAGFPEPDRHLKNDKSDCVKTSRSLPFLVILSESEGSYLRIQ